MARPAPASVRATSIVSFLTAHPSRGFTISELVRHLGMNIASAHATLAVLCDCGFVVRDPVHRTYVLGPALAATGHAAHQQHPAIDAATEQADRLADELDAEVGVTAIAGRDVIFLARRGPEPLAPSIGYPGDRSPLLAPIGAVFMAWADHDTTTAWIQRAALTDELAAYYRAVLADIRSRGFSVPLPPIASPAMINAMARVRSEPTDEDAVQRLAEVLQRTEEMLVPLGNLDESDEIVFKTVAAPVFDPIGRVLLSLSVTGPEEPVRVADVLELGRRVAQSASIATRRARGRVPVSEADTPQVS
ncbi:helix-turn-helix domain-containing protein [Yinghuangia sp. ASG 101]|uniref:IclR family transcriptional regulator n=1 Tax=Yinghuangia sp. ASG 101 TaxID=2896848 RepID=UPI001E2F7C2D|nr:helix-turn-helix domain-containing protein [Yinghuangia sp. ASG 101]UGQ13367.1 helix-turn-helix domain-containing protein [Yinghuangia sp. ASG 101]